MKHVKVFEETFIKLDKIHGKIKDFEGFRPFKLDKDEGKLYRTTESMGEYFLTYEEYLKLEGLNDSIAEKIKLLNEQKKTTVEIKNCY